MSEPTAAPGRAATIRTSRTPVAAVLGGVGDFCVGFVRWISAVAGLGAVVVVRALRLESWRRPVREEFARVFIMAAWQGLLATLCVAVLVGGALVNEGFYWLRTLGNIDAIRQLLIDVLVDYMAPLLVALLVIGRTGVVMTIEIATMNQKGMLDVLRAQGLNLIGYVVMPRTLALALAVFCLTEIFVVVALSAGHIIASLLGVARESFFGFVDAVVSDLPWVELVRTPLKTLLMGFVIGLTSCLTALDLGEEISAVGSLVARTFIRSLLLAAVLSVVMDLLL